MILAKGKYRGRDLEEVPSSYLKYIVNTWEEEEIVLECESELKYRDDHNSHFED